MTKDQRETLEFVYQKLAQIIDAFDLLLSPLRETRADELKAGKGDVLKNVSDGTSSILVLADAMQHTTKIHGLEINLDFIREQFAELLGGVENEDFPLVADIIEYELLPMLCEWFDELDAIFGDEE